MAKLELGVTYYAESHSAQFTIKELTTPRHLNHVHSTNGDICVPVTNLTVDSIVLWRHLAADTKREAFLVTEN